MELIKNIFGEKLPISELQCAQDRLSKYGMKFLLPALFNQHDKLRESDVLNLIEREIIKNGWTMIHLHQNFGCGINTNADTIGYIPEGKGWPIQNGDRVVLWITYKSNPQTNSYLSSELQKARAKLNPKLHEHTIKALLLAQNFSVDCNSEYSAFRSLANLYISRHNSEFQDTSEEELASHISTAIRVDHFESMLGVNSSLGLNSYHSETFVKGDTINSKELKKHKAVINSLCVALECLQERTKYRDYEAIGNRVYKMIVQECGKEPAGYWMNIHQTMGGNTLHNFSFAYLCAGSSFMPIDNRPVFDGDRIYIHPFIKGIHYGFMVTVTSDGWTVN